MEDGPVADGLERLHDVFVPFAILYMKQPVKLDYLWACLCVMGALYFMFRAQS